jgi:hypothetical protein
MQQGSSGVRICTSSQAKKMAQEEDSQWWLSAPFIATEGVSVQSDRRAALGDRGPDVVATGGRWHRCVARARFGQGRKRPLTDGPCYYSIGCVVKWDLNLIQMTSNKFQMISKPFKLHSIQTGPSWAWKFWNKIWFWRILWEKQLSL